MGGTPLVVAVLPGLKYEAAREDFTLLWPRFISHISHLTAPAATNITDQK